VLKVSWYFRLFLKGNSIPGRVYIPNKQFLGESIDSAKADSWRSKIKMHSLLEKE
jgi:hypothetical protein